MGKCRRFFTRTLPDPLTAKLMFVIRAASHGVLQRSSNFRSTFQRCIMTSVFERVLGASILAADKAGDVVRGVMKGGNLDIVQKTGEDDLQTAADRIVNDILVGSLRKQFPGLVVIGEEGDAKAIEESLYVTGTAPYHLADAIPSHLTGASVDQLTVWVDPLDATKEYTEGYLDHVTVLIGIAFGDDAVAGVIHQPFYGYKESDDSMGRTLYGVVGAGVGGALKPQPPPEGQRIIATSRSHSSPQIRATVEALKPTEIIGVGGAGHKALLVMEGEAHVYLHPSPGCKKWDTCAPEAVLRAMGGVLTDIRGDKYTYNKDVVHMDHMGVLATFDTKLHAQMVAEIPPQAVKQLEDKQKGKK